MGLRWRDPSRPGDARFSVLLAATALLLLAAALLGLPFWLAPVAAALITAALLAAWRLDDAPLTGVIVRASFGAALVLLGASGLVKGELARLFMAAPAVPLGEALLRWGAVTAIAVALARRERLHPARHIRDARGTRAVHDPSYEFAAAFLGYGLVAQIVPATWLPVATALGLLAVTEFGERRWVGPALGARQILALIAFGWAVWPLAFWATHGLRALLGVPMLVTGVPAPGMVLWRLLVPAALLAAALARGWRALPPLARGWSVAPLAVTGLVAVHSLYKLVFMIDGPARFTTWGLAERSLWELLLIAAALLLWRVWAWRRAALALLAVAAAHWGWFTLLLHDPLWSDQAVGGLPIVNLLLPMMAVPVLATWGALRIAPEAREFVDQPVQLGAMALILLYAYASLRQIFVGGLLDLPGLDPTENVLRSVLAILLAIGYLLWGIRSGRRIWRLASLVLMSLAVAKVFLFDAAGLQGLLRIASFMALGFSLIGIGWLYSRTLRA
ncbi:MAG: hypothetical protein A4S12_07490 [Proteobacteria bacterium SG_bin5]|nr:MAG: hypothetical protein A4S12_07490 [Proteobacteria bacterium SG_bin5]